MITEIDAKLLEKIADLTGKPVGAFNIRKDSGCEARQSTEHIDISPRTDGKSGIDIRFKPGTKGEKCYIPVIISKTGVSELVYNDFYVAWRSWQAAASTTPAATKAVTTASIRSISAKTPASAMWRSTTGRKTPVRPAATS